MIPSLSFLRHTYFHWILNHINISSRFFRKNDRISGIRNVNMFENVPGVDHAPDDAATVADIRTNALRSQISQFLDPDDQTIEPPGKSDKLALATLNLLL